ncbi:MAG TPA: hypothetical protein QF499_05405 [Gammaproteobacteria bacterium]|nr:hypothetical protein [Gammaproteobacteria bacterium]HJP38554.1 hypothetical protein [Gammaproteobacteria bacterium]
MPARAASVEGAAVFFLLQVASILTAILTVLTVRANFSLLTACAVPDAPVE